MSDVPEIRDEAHLDFVSRFQMARRNRRLFLFFSFYATAIVCLKNDDHSLDASSGRKFHKQFSTVNPSLLLCYYLRFVVSGTLTSHSSVSGCRLKFFFFISLLTSKRVCNFRFIFQHFMLERHSVAVNNNNNTHKLIPQYVSRRFYVLCLLFETAPAPSVERLKNCLSAPSSGCFENCVRKHFFQPFLLFDAGFFFIVS